MSDKNTQNCNFSSYVDEQRRGPVSALLPLSERSGAQNRAFSRSDRKFSRFRPPVAAKNAGAVALLLFCTCAFSLTFALKLSRSGESVETFKNYIASNEAENGYSTEEDELGKLHFVEMPSLLSVFAPSRSPIAPLGSEKQLTNDDMTLSIYASNGSEVVSMLDGTVLSVDSTSGSVTVEQSDGASVTYFHLDPITVERGQPVLQKTVLGVLKGDELKLLITRDGRPVDPVKYLGVGAEIG